MKFSLFFSLNTFQTISTLTVILLCVIFVSFLFSNLLLTTEAMGIWRFAGAFAVVKRQSECGSKTAGMHVSQPMNIGVC